LKRWCENPKFRQLVAEKNFTRQPNLVNRLHPLPNEFGILVNRASTFKCPSLQSDESRTPTICLVCGEIVCSQGYCCQQKLDGHQVGACTYHAHLCSADVGMFLRIRECQAVFLAHRRKGSFYAAPYVDEYGETDQGFRRGNPLFLNNEMYNKLQKIWLNHNVQEEVASHLDYHQTLLAMDWQLL